MSIVVGYIYYTSHKNYRDLRAKLSKEYKDIKKEDEINSKIVSTYFPEDWRGSSIEQFVKLENVEKVHLNIYFLRHNSPNLNTIVKAGTILKKDKGSDTLKLYNGENEYVYLVDYNVMK